MPGIEVSSMVKSDEELLKDLLYGFICKEAIEAFKGLFIGDLTLHVMFGKGEKEYAKKLLDALTGACFIKSITEIKARYIQEIAEEDFCWTEDKRLAFTFASEEEAKEVLKSINIGSLPYITLSLEA